MTPLNWKPHQMPPILWVTTQNDPLYQRNHRLKGSYLVGTGQSTIFFHSVNFFRENFLFYGKPHRITTFIKETIDWKTSIVLMGTGTHFQSTTCKKRTLYYVYYANSRLICFLFFFKVKKLHTHQVTMKLCTMTFLYIPKVTHSLNSRDLFLNLRRLVKMTKPLRFENKSLRLKYKCLICIWIIFWAILDLFINPKYLFQISLFHRLIILSPKKVLSF